uniref:tetratricopeptide repeat protein n=1 Tax=Roseburia sp. TaxID=2049040 RepID=UPI003FF11EC6
MAELDKYEYKLKLDQMKSLTSERKYDEAAEIADTINWHKIKNVNALIKAGEIYEAVGRYEESREILLAAYDRSPIGRMIIYRLAEVAIKMKDFEEAKDYYQEFVEIAPHDNLKYVLKYKICRAQGADINTLIAILEELKEQEYSEEWAYQLAYLYHKAGMSEKCVDACDELILWFGDGPYVERALELKMLYQPLSKQQEDKYRRFRQQKEGIVEVRPEDTLESGEVVRETVQIPDVELSPERFNTQNLQEELQKSMQQIMDATKKETVQNGMDNIKKLVEDIPYLQIPKEEPVQAETGQEIDDSLKINFKNLLAEEHDGQISMCVPDSALEHQITGQMSIEEILAEWERTRHAAEVALQEAEQQKLESAKAKALQEAGDIMGRLADVMPKLDPDFAQKGLLEEPNIAGNPIEEDKAAQMVANMNQLLQQEIDRLSNENARMDEKLAAAAAGTETVYQEEPETFAAPGVMELTPEAGEEQMPQEDVLTQKTKELPKITLPDEYEPLEEEFMAEEPEIPEADEEAFETEEPEIPETDEEAFETEEPEESLDGEAIDENEELPEIKMPDEDDVRNYTIRSLNGELREIFTYFVSIKGMEKQICQALTGAGNHLANGKTASTGNLVIQGAEGSGKTMLATDIVKALQKEVGKPNGKVGKIEAEVLNQKDIAELLKKVAGGCLIIEKAGNLSREAAVKLGLLLASDTSGTFVIMEDTHKNIANVLAKDEGFAARFSEKIQIPIFTSDELVAFAKAYANELGYTIDEMGILALYNSISNIQKLDKATTLMEIKEIVDQAIRKSEKGALKKAFHILTARRYDENDYIILYEKDFEF